MNKVQRNIYMQAHPHAQQRLEFFSSRLDEQWTKAATVEEEGLDVQERSFVEKRKEIVRAKLSSLLNEELCDDDLPCISLCSSGGGVRAMV